MISLGIGKCSSFGGPHDLGVAPQEGLGLVEPRDLQEWWFDRCFFVGTAYDGSMGLARNLNPDAFYCAMRWAYGSFDHVQGEILAGYTAEQIRRSLFRVGFAGKFIYVQAVDWGPNLHTGRLIDLSPGCLQALGIRTDDIVSVDFLG